MCHPNNDREDIGKLRDKDDAVIFIGYADNSRAFRIYDQRTKRITETMNVKFDEISQMAYERLADKDLKRTLLGGHLSPK